MGRVLLTLVHGASVLVGEASSGGSRAVQAAWNDDGGRLGEGRERRGGGHGRLRQAHGDGRLGNRCLGEGHAGHQVDLRVGGEVSEA